MKVLRTPIIILSLFLLVIPAISFGQEKDKTDGEKIAAEREKINDDWQTIKEQILSSSDNKNKKAITDLAGIEDRITSALSTTEKAVADLSASDSIVSKMKQLGINTEEIQNRLTDAQTFIDQAKADLVQARQKLSDAISPNPDQILSKDQIGLIKKNVEPVLADITSAQVKAKDAIRLIKEIPQNTKSRAATSTPAENN